MNAPRARSATARSVRAVLSALLVLMLFATAGCVTAGRQSVPDEPAPALDATAAVTADDARAPNATDAPDGAGAPTARSAADAPSPAEPQMPARLARKSSAPRYAGPVSDLADGPDVGHITGLEDVETTATDSDGRPDGLTIDTSDRQAVVDAYRQIYLPSGRATAGWTGSVEGCKPGRISPDYREAMRTRVNYFRAMTGQVGNVRFDALRSFKAQKAALMMLAANDLSHTPSRGWPCYSIEGAQAAGASNLYLGRAGPAAITGYVADEGMPAVEHRRWVLYPPTAVMGVGDTGHSNALWVLDDSRRPDDAPPWVAWPPDGYVPYQLAFDQWSFSRPDTDFSSAQVSMTRNGAPLDVTVVHRTEDAHGDLTLVWTADALPSYPRLDGLPRDEVLEVRLDDVVTQDGTRSFSYQVTLIDPAQQVTVVTLTPTTTPTAGVTPTLTPTRAAGTPTPTNWPPSATPPPSTTPRPPTDPAPTPTSSDDDLPEPVRCPSLRAPEAAIEAALEDPSSVRGWGELCDPSKPFHPISNTYRRSLTLQNPNVPYNPMSNRLVFRCGCR